MKAKLISTQGPYLEAEIEINGQILVVMDEFSLWTDTGPKPGETFDIEFFTLLNEQESWESIFQGNPENKIDLERISSWRYRAFGRIIAINPVRVDCGLFVVEDVIWTHDPRVIGEYIAFTISRLDGEAIARHG